MQGSKKSTPSNPGNSTKGFQMKIESLPHEQVQVSFFDQILASDIIKRPGFLQSINLLCGFVALTLIFYTFSFLIDNELDWRILLYLNPDTHFVFIDNLMILVTDFSMYFFGLVFLFYEIGCQISKHTQIAKKNIVTGMKIIGVLLSILIGSAHFWAGYTHNNIFFPLALIQLFVFWFMSNRVVQIDDAVIDRFNRLFWMTALAVLLTELSVEVIKETVARLRPLSGGYNLYAQGIRIVADEGVQGGHSYVASHSAVFFAMITPLFYFISKKSLRAGLILWALVHAFSRVYLAAHFPYCSVMGAALGFSMGTLVFRTFGGFEHSLHISRSLKNVTGARGF
ncbi:phosphatase PAP2 family protein [Thermodesulfobacteriota bacterium]